MNPANEIDRTSDYAEYRTARRYAARYAPPRPQPRRPETRDALARAREVVDRFPEFRVLPTIIPSSPATRAACMRAGRYDGMKVYRKLASILDDPRKRNHGRHRIAHETYITRATYHGDPIPHRMLPICIQLHATDIVTVYPDGEILLNHGGWTTNTTSQRFREFISDYLQPAGFPGVYVGKAYLPDDVLPDKGRATWYVHIHDPGARFIGRRARLPGDH